MEAATKADRAVRHGSPWNLVHSTGIISPSRPAKDTKLFSTRSNERETKFATDPDTLLIIAARQAECIIADHVAGVERTAWPEVLAILRKAIVAKEG